MIFGRDRELIKAELGDDIPVRVFVTLKEALDHLGSILNQYGPLPILFSPGCASFDEFQNFERRGDYFVERMRQIPGFKAE
jgi:UDP-N-acetylmuramoylalanine--D-glutamate ligase